MGKLLKKADILATTKKAFEPQEVYVPDWGGSIRFKPMSMSERRQIRKKCMTPGTDENGNPTQDIDQEMMELWAIVTCVLDPEDDKKLMFGPQDITVLENEMAAGALSIISIAVLKASGLGPDSFRAGEGEAEEGAGVASNDATVQGEGVLAEGS